MMFLDMAQCMHWHNDVVGQIQAEHHQEDRCPIGYRHPKSCAEKEGLLYYGRSELQTARLQCLHTLS